MTKWFSGIMGATTWCKEVFSLRVLAGSVGYAVDLFIKVDGTPSLGSLGFAV